MICCRNNRLIKVDQLGGYNCVLAGPKLVRVIRVRESVQHRVHWELSPPTTFKFDLGLRLSYFDPIVAHKANTQPAIEGIWPSILDVDPEPIQSFVRKPNRPGRASALQKPVCGLRPSCAIQNSPSGARS